MEHMENPPIAGNEPQKERKTGLGESLWWPRITGMVLAFVTILPMMFTPSQIWAVSVLLVAAAAFFWKGKKGVIAVRWWAKIVGTFMAVLLAGILFGEGATPTTLLPPVLTISAVLEFLSLVLLFAGVVIAFRWELIGGALIALFGLWQTGKFLVAGNGVNPYLSIFVLTGLGLVYCWWRTRWLSRQTPA